MPTAVSGGPAEGKGASKGAGRIEGWLRDAGRVGVESVDQDPDIPTDDPKGPLGIEPSEADGDPSGA